MGKVTVFFVISMVALLALCIYGAAIEHKEWEEFKQDHSCKIVGKMDGDVVVGFGSSSNGSVVTTISTTDDKTGWLCDDGITYWK